MRSTLFSTLLLLFIGAVNCGPLPSNCDDPDASEAAAVQCGNDGVQLVRPGYVELVISGDFLVVGVNIKECEGKVLFCYPAKLGRISPDAKVLCSEWPGYCGLQLDGTENEKITLTLVTNALKEGLEVCYSDIRMQYGEAKYCKKKSGSFLNDVSCDAATSQDGRIGIHVKNADPQNCPVFIKYAKIYVPPTTTPVPTTAHPSTAPSSNKTAVKNEDKAAEAAIWPWIVLGVGIALILIGIFIGLFICWIKKWCMFKKKTAETSPPRPVEEIISTTVEAKAEAKIEREYEKIKAEHPGLKEVISKKSKKASRPPPPPSAEPVKKLSPPPPAAKSAKTAKEKKAKTPPPPTPAAAQSKKVPKEKKAGPASPGKKIVQKKAAAPSAEKKISKEATKTEGQSASTQSYSAPFCLMPVRAPSPPLNPNGGNVNINRKPGQKGAFKNSLELPSYSGGQPVPPSESIQREMKKNAAAEKAREAERRKKEREERKRKK